METTNSTTDKPLKAKQLMIMNALAYNKFLTVEHLKALPLKELLCNVHPQDRARLESLYEDELETAEKEQKEKQTLKRTKYGES